ncbi:hydrogenase maturation nickel metallochaperone HypA [Nostoc sp. 'Peltigera membranacea cyanobiont' 213]|uniref:hydrogenase maturation nickel metallochaperone HypA n=1 Tax=unclassified Nostoc TaxID=2593658 RepID=UPI000B9544D3|nr:MULTISPECIES: hydrogenase maturation nickel metallochaperone HypA [unclassified Nostoc]AVH62063.1 hydrogenase nickel incorporation protein HypA/HybF [Nostoc sp. 'Peltigera membranacea cyanobiont' N6]OYD99513.1 hydrogenase maturation nickel metallochaperone HypA [Nostoc sp. 'Peltigera membranacea cyanobiont' 213]
MHEFGITQNIVAIVTEHAKGAKVQRVLLEIGKLSAIMPDAIRFCFDICTQGTVLEGATLEIVEIPGLGRCRQCGAEIYLDKPFGICSCGSVQLDLIAGEELKIKEIEIEELCV